MKKKKRTILRKLKKLWFFFCHSGTEPISNNTRHSFTHAQNRSTFARSIGNKNKRTLKNVKYKLSSTLHDACSCNISVMKPHWGWLWSTLRFGGRREKNAFSKNFDTKLNVWTLHPSAVLLSGPNDNKSHGNNVKHMNGKHACSFILTWNEDAVWQKRTEK